MPDYWCSAPIRRLRHPVEDSPLWSLLGGVLWALLGLAVGAPFLLLLSLVLPICLLARWALKPAGTARTISAADRRWLGPAWCRSVLHAVLLLEPRPNITNLRNLIATKVIPSYPQLLNVPVGLYWRPDEKFDIDRHVFHAANDAGLSERRLQEYVSRLLTEGLPNDKPPWELQILHRHAILRVHQSLADGKQLVRVLCHALADCRVNPVPFGSVTFLFRLVHACVLGPLSLLCWVFLTAQDCNIFTRKHVWTGKDCVAWSSAIPLAQVTHIKLVTRCSANCVLLAALAGAMRCLLQGCGVAHPPNVRVLVPASMGNWTAPVLLTLPVEVEAAIPRLWKTRRSLEQLHRSARPGIAYLAALALLALPSCRAVRFALAALTGKASLQFSSMRGPTNVLRVDGTSVVGVYPFHPAPPGVGVSITAFVYADRLYLAAVTDSSLEPAGHLLLHHLQGQVAQMHRMLLHRRIPGESRQHLLLRRADVTASPTRELRLRLSSVQEEVTHRLCDGLETDRVQTLKLEFSHLLCELRRRKSLVGDDDDALEDEEIGGAMWRPQRRRSLSCSALRRPARLAVAARPASYVEPSTARILTARPLSWSDSDSYYYSPSSVNDLHSVTVQSDCNIIDGEHNPDVEAGFVHLKSTLMSYNSVSKEHTNDEVFADCVERFVDSDTRSDMRTATAMSFFSSNVSDTNSLHVTDGSCYSGDISSPNQARRLPSHAGDDESFLTPQTLFSDNVANSQCCDLNLRSTVSTSNTKTDYSNLLDTASASDSTNTISQDAGSSFTHDPTHTSSITSLKTSPNAASSTAQLESSKKKLAFPVPAVERF